jgi:taurine dioxygenase
MSYQHISVTPASPHIGAEIGNIDLTKPLADAQVAELKKAFLQYQVIFFREQKISFDDQVRVAGYFGPLGRHVGVNTISKTTDNPLVRKFHYDETSKRISGENWHSDQSCAAVPPLGSMLYNHTVPPDGGGDTMFASSYAAYEALSPNMKKYLDGLTATHDGTRVFGPGTPVSVHPLITRHPETGRNVIYVNTDFTSHINEVPRAEGNRILEFLYAHVGRDEWACRFRWRAHSIAFWDNRCAQHKALWDYWPNVRSGFRVQVEGTATPVAGSLAA